MSGGFQHRRVTATPTGIRCATKENEIVPCAARVRRIPTLVDEPEPATSWIGSTACRREATHTSRNALTSRLGGITQ
jgi:hypothetical protein